MSSGWAPWVYYHWDWDYDSQEVFFSGAVETNTVLQPCEGTVNSQTEAAHLEWCRKFVCFGAL